MSKMPNEAVPLLGVSYKVKSTMTYKIGYNGRDKYINIFDESGNFADEWYIWSESNEVEHWSPVRSHRPYNKKVTKRGNTKDFKCKCGAELAPILQLALKLEV